MSGDVQPRKRKDKKRKKDDLGIEEPRGTAAVLGEGDVFIHSHHEHSTGGHWCAKIIFFSLLAVLITLIGLIILENRGLTELEANSVASRYSGVLEGWIEDVPDDDHHDEHTLELKHPDDDHESEDHLDDESDHENEDHDIEEHEDDDEDNTETNEEEDEDEDNTETNEEEDDDENDENEDEKNSEENLEEADDEEVEEKVSYSQYNYYEQKYKIDDDDDDDNDNENNDSQEIEEQKDDNLSNESDAGYYRNEDADGEDDEQNYEDDDEQSEKDDDGEDDEQGDEDDEIRDADDDDEQGDVDDDEIDDKHYIEQNDDKNIDESQENNENSDEDNDQDDAEEHDDEENQEQDEDDQEDEEQEVEKIEREVIDDDDVGEDSEEVPKKSLEEGQDEEESKEYVFREEDDEDSQETDDDEPPVERITTPPAGKPFVEIEEEVSEKPIDTLAEEEEYEKRQEELRREEAQASHMWLKLAVGGALLVATHAVLRRATAPRDAPEPEDRSREETPPLPDRRMTLISQSKTPTEEKSSVPAPRQIIEEEVFKKPAPVVKSEPILKQDVEQMTDKKIFSEKVVPEEINPKDDEEKELYSDEDDVEEEEEEEDIVVPTKVTTTSAPQKKTPEAATEEKEEESEPEEVPDDVEIIDDEQIEDEEEVDEDVDEEEISDVDDTELLTRLEAKYGRLPEPERPGKHKEGGNSIEDEWPGEPSESYWREQLDIAEEELRQGALDSCGKRVAASELKDSARARWLAARALDLTAEIKRDNQILSKAISAYLHLLKMNERLSNKKLLEVAHRALDRIQFRGYYMNAEPIYRLLIRRFPYNIDYRNNLTIAFLMANRADLADDVLKETLRLQPNDRIALAHYGFVLKNHYNKLEAAVFYLERALDGDAGPANEPRFYYHLGEALIQLGRTQEAREVHKRGAALGHFLSPPQRSLYNVPRLRSRPWWPVEKTPYVRLARKLEKLWRLILKEAEAAMALYEQEKEGLRESGEWSQLDLFVRGEEVPGRCAHAPVTCGAVRGEIEAPLCRRGQIKFSAMTAGTHVRAHVGPTNCRLRMHLALSNTDNTYLRVHDETREWKEGKTFIFDDSFEHEVWHNGTGTRLVLIVDLWHPDLTPAERLSLPAI